MPLGYKPELEQLLTGCCESESMAGETLGQNLSTNPQKDSYIARKENQFEF